MLLPCSIIVFSTLFTAVNCIKVYFGRQTDTGKWSNDQDHALPMHIAGASYFFSLSDFDWFIKPLFVDGTLGENTDSGRFIYRYTKSFTYNINGRQYLYAITDSKYWFIQEILPKGIMGKELARGYWSTSPDAIFPVNVNGKYFVVTITEDNYDIQELTPNGELGKETDRGELDRTYTRIFPFIVYGRQFFYCYSEETKMWSIFEIKYNGKIGEEIDSGVWNDGHLLYTPFYMRGKTYFYGLTANKRDWFIKELLPGGRMSVNRGSGSWKNYYALMFAFKVDGNQYIYAVDQTKTYTIHKLHQDPPFCPVLLQPRSYCNEESKLRCGIRYPRLERLANYGATDAACAEFNYIGEYMHELQSNHYFRTIDIENDAATSITSYTQLTLYPLEYITPTVNLTIAMEAEIHETHIMSERTTKPSNVSDPVKQDLMAEQGDEAGYLLAPILGGTTESYNFVPQSPMVDRKLLVAGSSIRAPQSGWFDVESLVRNFVRKTQGYVRWSLVVLYGNLLNTRRPTEFWLTVRLYNGTTHKLTSWQGNRAVTGYHFRNVPTVACTDLKNEWWNIPY